MPQEEAIGHILETFQRIEITEYHIYKRLAKRVKDPENRKILNQLADEERLRYAGSVVLGLNDALVELTGGLA